eukprot:tig00020562_g11158.t1
MAAQDAGRAFLTVAGRISRRPPLREPLIESGLLGQNADSWIAAQGEEVQAYVELQHASKPRPVSAPVKQRGRGGGAGSGDELAEERDSPERQQQRTTRRRGPGDISVASTIEEGDENFRESTDHGLAPSPRPLLDEERDPNPEITERWRAKLRDARAQREAEGPGPAPATDAAPFYEQLRDSLAGGMAAERGPARRRLGRRVRSAGAERAPALMAPPAGMSVAELAAADAAAAAAMVKPPSVEEVLEAKVMLLERTKAEMQSEIDQLHAALKDRGETLQGCMAERRRLAEEVDRLAHGLAVVSEARRQAEDEASRARLVQETQEELAAALRDKAARYFERSLALRAQYGRPAPTPRLLLLLLDSSSASALYSYSAPPLRAALRGAPLLLLDSSYFSSADLLPSPFRGAEAALKASAGHEASVERLAAEKAAAERALGTRLEEIVQARLEGDLKARIEEEAEARGAALRARVAELEAELARREAFFEEQMDAALKQHNAALNRGGLAFALVPPEKEKKDKEHKKHREKDREVHRSRDRDAERDRERERERERERASRRSSRISALEHEADVQAREEAGRSPEPGDRPALARRGSVSQSSQSAPVRLSRKPSASELRASLGRSPSVSPSVSPSPTRPPSAPSSPLRRSSSRAPSVSAQHHPPLPEAAAPAPAPAARPSRRSLADAPAGSPEAMLAAAEAAAARLEAAAASASAGPLGPWPGNDAGPEPRAAPAAAAAASSTAAPSPLVSRRPPPAAPVSFAPSASRSALSASAAPPGPSASAAAASAASAPPLRLGAGVAAPPASAAAAAASERPATATSRRTPSPRTSVDASSARPPSAGSARPPSAGPSSARPPTPEAAAPLPSPVRAVAAPPAPTPFAPLPYPAPASAAPAAGSARSAPPPASTQEEEWAADPPAPGPALAPPPERPEHVADLLGLLNQTELMVGRLEASTQLKGRVVSRQRMLDVAQGNLARLLELQILSLQDRVARLCHWLDAPAAARDPSAPPGPPGVAPAAAPPPSQRPASAASSRPPSRPASAASGGPTLARESTSDLVGGPPARSPTPAAAEGTTPAAAAADQPPSALLAPAPPAPVPMTHQFLSTIAALYDDLQLRAPTAHGLERELRFWLGHRYGLPRLAGEAAAGEPGERATRSPLLHAPAEELSFFLHCRLLVTRRHRDLVPTEAAVALLADAFPRLDPALVRDLMGRMSLARQRELPVSRLLHFLLLMRKTGTL